MSKIRNFAEIAPSLPFTEYDFYEEYRGAFEKTELGRMKKILPLHEMAKRITWTHTWTQILPETKGPEEVLQASGHRAGHWLPEIRPPEDAELPQGHPWDVINTMMAAAAFIMRHRLKKRPCPLLSPVSWRWSNALRICYLKMKTDMPAGAQLLRWLRNRGLAGLTM